MLSPVHSFNSLDSRLRYMRQPLIVGGLLILCAFSAQAQYRFDNWTTDNGLPQNSVSSITQTRDGYLWFTTADGLVRFDGVRFTIFDQSNSRGLNSNRFTGLYEDKKEGTLWAGTEDGGLARYRDGIFTTLTTADGLPNNSVLGVQGDGAGGLIMPLLRAGYGITTACSHSVQNRTKGGIWWFISVPRAPAGSWMIPDSTN